MVFTKNSITLQEDLAKLQEWSLKWGLHFNVNKCHVLHIGYNNPRYKYILKSGEEESVLNICSEEKTWELYLVGSCPSMRTFKAAYQKLTEVWVSSKGHFHIWTKSYFS